MCALWKTTLAVALVGGLLGAAPAAAEQAEAPAEAPAQDEQQEIALGDTDWNSLSFVELGATIGMPAVANLMVGFWSGPGGVVVSGMRWSSEAQGAQLGLGYRFVNPTRGEHRGLVVGGRMDLLSADTVIQTVYVGPVYHFHGKHGLFFEGGMVVPFSGYDLPQIWLQVGWAGRIRVPVEPLV